MSRIYTLHGPRPYFDSKEEGNSEPTKEVSQKDIDKKFEADAEKLAKEHGLIEDKKESKEEANKSANKEEKDSASDKDSEGATEEGEDSEEEELAEEQLKQAKTIFKLLNNPQTALQALDTLARTAGYSLQEIKEATKKEEKEIAKSIEEVVEEKLGTKIPFLSKELGPLLKEVISSAIKEQTKDLRETVERESAARREAEIKNAFEKALESYDNIPENVLKEVARIQEAQELIPGKMEPSKYFKSCLVLAADNLGVSLIKKNGNSTTKKIEVKKPDPLATLSATKKGSEGKDGLKVTQVKTLNDAINKAAEDIASKFA